MNTATDDGRNTGAKIATRKVSSNGRRMEHRGNIATRKQRATDRIQGQKEPRVKYPATDDGRNTGAKIATRKVSSFSHKVSNDVFISTC